MYPESDVVSSRSVSNTLWETLLRFHSAHGEASANSSLTSLRSWRCIACHLQLFIQQLSVVAPSCSVTPAVLFHRWMTAVITEVADRCVPFLVNILWKSSLVLSVKLFLMLGGISRKCLVCHGRFQYSSFSKYVAVETKYKRSLHQWSCVTSLSDR